MKPMIVVDVETTGLDPSRHSIVAIGAVDFSHPENQFYRECRIFTGAQVQEAALARNGFTVEGITDESKPTLESVSAEFIQWCQQIPERTLAGHNTAFDRNFLQSSADRYNLAWRFGTRVLDLHSFGWMHMTGHGHTPPNRGGHSGLSADAIFQYTGLPAEPLPHHGLMGAKMEAEAFCRLMHGHTLLREFDVHPLPAHVSLSTPSSDQQALF